jgi:hypothetical protein
VPPEDEGFAELVNRFDGRAIGDRWHAFNVVYDEESLDLPIGDFPSIFLSHIPVFSVRAVQALRPVLSTNGELLPLNSDYEKYFAFNVTTLLDALSAKDSDIVYYPSGRIMDVRKYVLDLKRVTFQSIFKLPETARMDVFVSDEFVGIVESHGLRGFSFKQVGLA